MVQDPNFWRRFSIAVHNDEAAILAQDNEEKGVKGKGKTKHAYVVSLSSPIDSPSPMTTPTSQCHLSPGFPPAAFTRPLSAPVIAQQPAKQSKKQRKSAATSGTRSVYFDAAEEKSPEMIALHKLPTYPQPTHSSYQTPAPSGPSTPKSTHFALPTTPTSSKKRASQRASRFRFALSSHPPTLPSTPQSATFPSLPHTPKRSSRFTAHRNVSRLSLGVSLSGRPKSAFKFWTTIEADAKNSDSWLEGQQRKARQRTWMCWAFWLVFLVVVVGGIVAVLVLKGKGII